MSNQSLFLYLILTKTNQIKSIQLINTYHSVLKVTSYNKSISIISTY
jgi:hypothetical protein